MKNTRKRERKGGDTRAKGKAVFYCIRLRSTWRFRQSAKVIILSLIQWETSILNKTASKSHKYEKQEREKEVLMEREENMEKNGKRRVEIRNRRENKEMCEKQRLKQISHSHVQ